MRKFAIVILMLALAIAAFFGGMQWSGHQAATGAPENVDAETSPDATIERPAPPSPTGAVAPADATTAANAPNAPAPWLALPPPDATVAEHYDELAERARRGYGNAACRRGVASNPANVSISFGLFPALSAPPQDRGERR